MNRRVLPFVLTVVVPFLAHSSPVKAQKGTRPRNVVVNSNGTVLATSMGSDYVTQLTWNGSSYDPPQYIDVGGKSWGICFKHDTMAIVSLPLQGKLKMLLWNPSLGVFEVVTSKTTTVPYYSTELINNPAFSRRVIVANRGPAPDNAVEDWQNAVYEVNMETQSITRTFLCDREPRALALAPDNNRLFVGHVQGAFGGDSFKPDSTVLTNHFLADDIYDGGSIIAFDLSNGGEDPILRFAIGSPVRGIAVSSVSNPAGGYRMYFTHVGFGAQAEDPDFGGRDIPNLISSIGFNSFHEPQDRQDVIYTHAPDANDVTTFAAILHEKLVVRKSMEGGQPVHQLWVSNSGSGTVSSANLDTDTGAILTCQGGGCDGVPANLTYSRISRTAPRNQGNGWITDNNIEQDFQIQYNDIVADQQIVNVSKGSSAPLRFSSNPRGIAYDSSRDVILAVNQLDHTLAQVTPGQAGSVKTDLTEPGFIDPVGDEERNFFTFGRGFDFREDVLGEALTNNITCGTCHVDGNLDGKVRFIVRHHANTGSQRPTGTLEDAQADKFAKPVQVPTVFDVGTTEWLFFEGLKTTRDGDDPRDGFTGSNTPPDLTCGYCQFDGVGQGFFFDTNDFTRGLSSPMSPYAPDGVLSAGANKGRLLFEAMNCSRCHGGATRQMFPRTLEAADNLPPAESDFNANGQFGPAPPDLEFENRLLHDPTQAMLRNDLRLFDCGGGRQSQLQMRNMTNVGTRRANDAATNGINTPALANGWDNRPYMHDGRYRTLEQVLRNTYVDINLGYRAAPIIYEGMPNNSKGGVIVEEVCDLDFSTNIKQFATHKQYPPASPPAANLMSVYDYLQSLGGNNYDNFIAFLNSVSSQTDLCTGASNIPPALGNPVVANGVSTFSWPTLVDAECRVTWGFSTQDPLPNEIITPIGTAHTVDLPTVAEGEYKIVVSSYTRGLCATQPTIQKTWNVDESSVQFAVNDSEVFGCPQGDADVLVVTVNLDTTGTFNADRFTIGPLSGGDVVIFPGTSGVIEADSAATDANGHTTTITLPHISGCASVAPGVAIPVLLDGTPIGAAYTIVRSPDMLSYGVINVVDVGEFAASYNKCDPEPGYSECANFTGGAPCVDSVDFSLFGNHYGHQAPGGPPSAPAAQLAASNLKVRMLLNSSEPARQAATVDVDNLRDVSSLSIVLRSNRKGDNVEWIPDGRFEDRTLFAPRPGFDDQWTLVVANVDGSFDATEVGTIVFASGKSASRTAPVVEMIEGTVLTHKGEIRRIETLDVADNSGSPKVLHNFLAQNHPNPFNPSTTIRYAIRQDARVTLTIYNVAGQLIRTLVDESQEAEVRVVTWDGRDDRGSQVATGVYFYRLDTPGFTKTRKMVLLK